MDNSTYIGKTLINLLMGDSEGNGTHFYVFVRMQFLLIIIEKSVPVETKC